MKIAIIGASGGIAKSVTQLLLSDSKVEKIFTFSRRDINFTNDRIIFHKIDICDEASIQSVIKNIDDYFDLVLVATGLLHDDTIMPEKNLSHLNFEQMETVFKVNTIGPTLIAKHFIPKLNKDKKAVFAALSARVSSISDNQLGGWYSYRASKTALNMILKNLSIEVKRSNPNAIIIGLHPGTVDTELSKPFQGNVTKESLFTPEISAKHLLNVIENVTLQDSGKLFAWDGSEITP